MSVAQDQLDAISLLQAMYPLSDELVLDPETEAFLADPSAHPPPSTLQLVLRIPLDSDASKRLDLQISLSAAAPAGKVSPRHPPWLSRSSYETLVHAGPAQHTFESQTMMSEYILETIERLRSEAENILQDQPSASAPLSRVQGPTRPLPPGPLERVWFWFPMLSTREKRRDLVEYAPGYGLTGFVIAGKPALLCLEGDGRQVERYMSDIKSVSWSDIPSFQKKVTERFRRPLDSEADRKFAVMTDATSLVPTYGQYNHRGDMGEVRRLMESWGVGDDFGAVILNSG